MKILRTICRYFAINDQISLDILVIKDLMKKVYYNGAIFLPKLYLSTNKVNLGLIFGQYPVKQLCMHPLRTLSKKIKILVGSKHTVHQPKIKINDCNSIGIDSNSQTISIISMTFLF